MSLFEDIDETEDDIFAPRPKPAKKQTKNIFDDLDESEDFSEKVAEKPKGRERTPECFNEIQQDSQMTLFSPGNTKTKDLFQFKDDEEENPVIEAVAPPKAPEETDMFGDPVGGNEDPLPDPEPDIEESFEVVDPEAVPSAEEAERELAAIAKEQERMKEERERAEQEKAEQERTESEAVARDVKEEEREESHEEQDGGAFSRAIRHEEPKYDDDDLPPPLPTSDMPSVAPPDDIFSVPAADEPVVTNEPPTDDPPADEPPPTLPAPTSDSTSNDEKVIQAEKALLEAVDEIEALTMKLNQAQEEVNAMYAQVEFFKGQWEEEKEKAESLEAKLKEKDREIAALKEAATKTSKPPLSKRPSSTSVAPGTKPKPAPATAKPTSAKPSSAKPTSKPPTGTSSSTKAAASSPKTSSKLRSDESRRGQPSVAEAVKKFGGPQEVPRKSPNIRRSSKVSDSEKADTQKPSPRSTKRKDSTSDKKEEKKTSSSPPKPPRGHRQPPTEETEEHNMNGTVSGNALDAIKMWENKTAGKASEPNPPAKKPLTGQMSSPIVSSTKVEEEERSAKESSEVNGSTEDTPPEVEDKENKEKVEETVPTRESHSVDSITRKMKSFSAVEPDTKASPKVSGKRGFTPAVIEKCFACKKTVYTVERLKADDKVYHKNCFKCSYCKKVVGTGTYAANKGEIYCKTHFKMLFKMKGNYDEGFGREQHKKKWGATQGAEQAAE